MPPNMISVSGQIIQLNKFINRLVKQCWKKILVTELTGTSHPRATSTYIDESVQKRCNFIANALELHLLGSDQPNNNEVLYNDTAELAYRQIMC